ncbi:MAG TPA: glycosyl hydrolase family 28-related protein [Chloroflexota bacterium]|nr:glycosyl hydrolase family 28-related protein [Chloroflexota bacterium]
MFLRLAIACVLALGGLGMPRPAASLSQALGHARANRASGLPPSHVRYNAADAWLTGGPAVRNDGSSAAYVVGFSKAGATAVFTVGIPADGIYAVALRYANGAPSTKTIAIYANGIRLQQASLPPTGGWSARGTTVDRLALRSGINTLAYASAGGAGDLRLDSIDVAQGSALAARGATLPYDEYEAEAARTNGTVTGPDRVFGDLAAEASGRRAVTLRTLGQYVEFTLRRPANGMVLRYSVPDSANGTGLTAPLSLYVDGRFQQALALTSRYTWLYGSYPFTNNPAGGGGHHFYDELHLLFGRTLSSGSTVRVQVDRGDTAPSYTIDLADFEQVPPPYPRPAGYLSLASFGADPTGHRDATAIIRRAVAAAEARHRGLYLPAGTYAVTGHIVLNNITLRGAGPWYTVLHGAGAGLYGDYPANSNQTYPANEDGSHGPSAHVQVYDLAIQGETTDRVDRAQVNGFGGALGGGSIIQNVWIEHTKVGMWFDGPFSDLLVVGCRMRDLTADGLNLHDGISNVTVEQTQVRNSGDDGLALWSDGDADAFDVFRNDTVQLPYLANNIAMYGGQQNSILDNYLSDTLTQGGGINIGNRDYGSAVVPLSGTIAVSGNTLVRTGQVDPNWGYGVGGLWFYAQTHSMTARIIVADDEIDDSTQEAVQFTGNERVDDVTFDHVRINRAATFAFQVQSDTTATFSHVVATNLGVAGVYNCGNAFTARQGPGNVGWSTHVCDNLLSLPTTGAGAR